jgi:RNA polymerase sigma-70 factor, ECF subfamily
VDEASRRWVERLQSEHERHGETIAQLHEIMHKAALHELHRRRGQLAALRGREFDDVAQQCADDAMVNVLAKLPDFQGLSRFTTWAYKFVIFEVSNKVARHAWQHHAPTADELSWERFRDERASPGEQVEQREQLSELSKAIEHELTPRQREVFVAIALNDVPIDVLALELGSNRNAIYKNLFDARKRLRACLEAVA